jgi:beta-lactamase class D
VLVTLLILTSHPTYAVDWQDSPEIEKLFKQYQVTGTFVLFDVSNNRMTGINQFQAATRIIPASTFKIPNTLIGLAVGAVKNVDEQFHYDGKPRFMKEWEKDMGLREAIKVSNVPVYQELARRIGLAKMRKNLKKIDYGNNDIGHVVDTFWLVGPLKISALEQAHFLARLAQNQLPFPVEIQAQVREIALLEQGNSWRLYGKTGWNRIDNPDVGWWVGWVENNKRIYSFALNIEIPNESYLPKRMELGKACLKALKVL